jgi:uncharacterized membrane protein YfcA
LIVLVVLLIALFAALAGTVGIGGGGFYTSILMIIGGLAISTAIPIASAITIGVGIASTIINIREKTINYKIALILEPATILGTIIGVQLHLIMPEEILIALLSLVLIILSLRTYMNAKRFHQDLAENTDLKNLDFITDLSKTQFFFALIGVTITGIISALIGIGGGLIKVPMMNELGLSPMMACGTGSFMVIFTSLSTTIQFLYFLTGILFFILGFTASLIGTGLSRYIKRPEIIQYLLAFAIAIAAILIIFTGFF